MLCGNPSATPPSRIRRLTPLTVTENLPELWRPPQTPRGDRHEKTAANAAVCCPFIAHTSNGCALPQTPCGRPLLFLNLNECPFARPTSETSSRQRSLPRSRARRVRRGACFGESNNASSPRPRIHARAASGFYRLGTTSRFSTVRLPRPASALPPSSGPPHRWGRSARRYRLSPFHGSAPPRVCPSSRRRKSGKARLRRRGPLQPTSTHCNLNKQVPVNRYEKK